MEFRKPVRTVREPPRWFRGQLQRALTLALQQWQRDQSASSWKLLLLIPRLLLQPTKENGDAGKKVFQEKMRRFLKGEWLELYAETPEAAPRSSREDDEQTLAEKRRAAAVGKVKLKELRRARVVLTSSGLAPGTQQTLDELTDAALRPRELTEPIPEHLLGFQPHTKLQLEPGRLVSALRSAGRGSAPDLSGARYEHYRVLLEDESLWSLFTSFCQAFARAEVPAEVSAGMRLGRMTALKKDNGRIRGIVAGSVLRRLTCKAVATQYSEKFMAATSPHQFALQTRAGTEAVAHALRFLTEQDPNAVVLSLDGVGAFDHVKRASFFRKLHAEPGLENLLPLVGMLYGSESRFLWTDSDGAVHTVVQAEGGERAIP